MKLIICKWSMFLIILFLILLIVQRSSVQRELFTPFIRNTYRPYVRYVNNNFESFVGNYGPEVVKNKLKKWNLV